MRLRPDDLRFLYPFVTQWQDGEFIRILIQGYNDQADVDALIQVLTRLLAYAAMPIQWGNLVGVHSY